MRGTRLLSGTCADLEEMGATENVGSDSGIGSSVEGIGAVFSGAGYGRPPLGCLTPSLESVGSSMVKKEDAVLDMDIYCLESPTPFSNKRQVSNLQFTL
jgi:hypothetical protein